MAQIENLLHSYNNITLLFTTRRNEDGVFDQSDSSVPGTACTIACSVHNNEGLRKNLTSGYTHGGKLHFAGLSLALDEKAEVHCVPPERKMNLET